MANKITLESRFPAVKAASHDLVRESVGKALGIGQQEAEQRLQRIDDREGYELPTQIDIESLGHQSGQIVYPHWYGRFFEYGTVRIAAHSFMRPAHRKMRKAFVENMGDNFEKWVRRRVRVRR